MDGYTYMIERNKLLIERARERTGENAQPPPFGSGDTGLRARLMELYRELEGCGRLDPDRSE